MSLTRWALENRTATLVFLAMLALAGSLSFGRLPRAEDPGFVIRLAVLSTFFPGASPEQVELLVTDPLEEAIEDLEQIHYVTSESRTGVSVIEVNFLESLSPAEIEEAFSELRETVSDARSALPAEAIGPLVNDDFGDVFGTVVAITGEGFDLVEMERVAERARVALLDLEDVSQVEIQGGQEQRVYIEYDPARLADYGLTETLLGDILARRNIVRPGGDVRTDHELLGLEVSGSFDSVEDLAAMRLRLASGEIVALEDVATVRRGTVEPVETYVTYMGEPAITFGIAMRDGGKITRLGPDVLDTLSELRAQLPVGLEFHLVTYQSSYVEKSISNFLGSLLQGIAIVLVVTLITLGLRTGL
ncbi:MAG: efflux RND transporter permease subunit, partial [Acidobacteriota bacterium]